MRSKAWLLALATLLAGCFGGGPDPDPGDALPASLRIDTPAKDAEWVTYSYAVNRTGAGSANGTWDVAIMPDGSIETLWTRFDAADAVLAGFAPGESAWDDVVKYPLRSGAPGWDGTVGGEDVALEASVVRTRLGPGVRVAGAADGSAIEIDIVRNASLPARVVHTGPDGTETWQLLERRMPNLTKIQPLRLGDWFQYDADWEERGVVKIVAARGFEKRLFGQDRITYRLDSVTPEGTRLASLMTEIDYASHSITTGVMNTLVPQILPAPFDPAVRINMLGSQYGGLIVTANLTSEEVAGGRGLVWALRATSGGEEVASWAYSPKARWLSRLDLDPLPDGSFPGASWRLLDFGTGFVGVAYEPVIEAFPGLNGTWEPTAAGSTTLRFDVPSVRFTNETSMFLGLTGIVPGDSNVTWEVTRPSGVADRGRLACPLKDDGGGCFLSRRDPYPYEQGSWAITFSGVPGARVDYVWQGRVLTIVLVGQ